MDSAYDRFCALMEENHMKPSDVTRESGVSSTVLTEWKKGKSTPKTEKMIAIAKVLNTSVEYLVAGDMPRWTQHPERLQPGINVTRKFDASCAHNADEMELLTRYRVLDEEKKRTVMSVLNALYNEATKGKEECQNLESA